VTSYQGLGKDRATVPVPQSHPGRSVSRPEVAGNVSPGSSHDDRDAGTLPRRPCHRELCQRGLRGPVAAKETSNCLGDRPSQRDSVSKGFRLKGRHLFKRPFERPCHGALVAEISSKGPCGAPLVVRKHTSYLTHK